MQSVETLSLRFDFARLHRWAWDRRVVRKERPLQEGKDSKHVVALLRQLTRHLLRMEDIHHKISIDADAYVMRIEFGQPLQILKQLALGDELPGTLRWESPSKRQRVLVVPYWEEGAWNASTQFLALEMFIKGTVETQETVNASAA